LHLIYPEIFVVVGNILEFLSLNTISWEYRLEEIEM